MRALILTLLLIAFLGPAAASQAEAEAALLEVLDSERIARGSYSYRVHEDGFVTILFSARILEEDLERVLDRLNRHPTIPGVLAAKDTDRFCLPW